VQRIGLVAAALLLWAFVPALAAGSPAAERQYRTARRLAAQGSPEARAALAKVVELDPDGPLADDALVDQALLESLAAWPEAAGALDAEAAARARQRLNETLKRFPASDRLDEALYHRGLLYLEPLVGYDPSAARVDLTAVATSSSEWATRARYALAWLHEREGDDQRALDAYQRLLVDEPDQPVGARARVGVARVLLRRADYGLAARRLQEAIDAGVPQEAGARSLLELSVRSLLREAGAGDSSRPVRTRTGVRAPAGFVPTLTGGILIGDRKRGTVLEFAAGGERSGEWTVEGVQTVAVDVLGRRFAADKTSVLRLEDGGRVEPLATLGEYTPLGELAPDATGGLWLLERKGRRVGLVAPGADAPQPYWEGTERLQSLVWDGRRLAALDAKTGVVVTLRSAGPIPHAAAGLSRPIALVADPAGRLAMLDKTGAIRFVRAVGGVEPAGFASPDVPRPTGIGLGPEGELHLLDAEGDWIVFR
jgi:tetratricopeptide (TPR) repeat protein